MSFFSTEPPRPRKYDHLTDSDYLSMLVGIDGDLDDYSLDDLDRLKHGPKPSLIRSCWTLLYLIGERRLVSLLREYVGEREPKDKYIRQWLRPLLFAASIATEPERAFHQARRTELVKFINRKQRA